MIISIVVGTAVFGWETWSGVRAASNPLSPVHRSEQTIRTLLPWFRPARLGFFLLGTLASVLALVASEPVTMVAAGVALAALFAAHLIERFGFFTAVTAPRMPGGI
jgi:hypothetical protein